VGTASFGTLIAGESGPVALVDDGAGTTSDGCSAVLNAAAVSGNIALIDRGTCNYTVKAANAQAAGAIGVLIANNVAGDPPEMGGIDASIVIPVLSITQGLGASIKSELGAGVVNVTLAEGGDTVNAGSSRGPRSGVPIRLKPDVAAPGTNIISTQTGRTSGGYAAGNAATTMSGTSMAAPHVAGIMALVKERYPTWTVAELKALLLNYSLHDLLVLPSPGSLRYGPGRVGSGRTDAALAATGQVIAFDDASPELVSVSFDGEFAVSGTLVRERTIRVLNRSASPQTFDLAVDTVVDAPGVAFSLPTSTVTIAAGGSETFLARLTADPAAMDQSRDGTVSAILSNGFPRYSIAEEGGYVTLAQAGTTRLRLPLYAFVRPASDMSASSSVIATGGNATGTGAITLAGTGLCSGTPGSSNCALGSSNDRVSVVTPLELQGTSAQRADLTGTSVASADVRHVGVGYDPATGLLLFGISTWNEWTSIPSFNISIDTNSDGAWDRIALNSAYSSATVNGGSPTDAHLVFVGDYTTLDGELYQAVNATGPAFDSNFYANNVAFFGVPLSALGLPAGTTSFRYRVDACPSLSVCEPTGAFDSAPGPTGYYEWDYAHPGLAFSGSWLADDLPGAGIPVSWNVARLSATGSLGALLLHHWNGGPLSSTAPRAEVLTLEAPVTDLSMTLSGNPTEVASGQALSYSAVVSNLGPSPAVSLRLTQTLPPGAIFVSATGDGWACAETSGTVTCDYANDLVAGESTLFATTALAPASPGTTISSTASATSLFGDPAPANNSATATNAVILAADLSVALAGTPAEVGPRQALAYVASITNLGPDPATSVRYSQDLPPGAVFVAAAGDGWTCGESAGVVICDLASLAAATTAAVVDVTISAPATPRATISSTATVSATERELVPTNNTTTATNSVTTAGTYYNLEPCRILDTRLAPDGTYAGPALPSGGRRLIPAFGQCGIPATARALALNVTVVSVAGEGFLRLFPANVEPPTTSTVNYSAGVTRANNAVIVLSPDGVIAVDGMVASGSIHFLIDVSGYFE
jgi:uncharacterized repeat protein (TIGR01451 family)